MERAPPPALAAMDDAFMDTPLSSKRPRQDDPPDQVGARANGPRPRTTEKKNLLKNSRYMCGVRQLASEPPYDPTLTPINSLPLPQFPL